MSYQERLIKEFRVEIDRVLGRAMALYQEKPGDFNFVSLEERVGGICQKYKILSGGLIRVAVSVTPDFFERRVVRATVLSYFAWNKNKERRERREFDIFAFRPWKWQQQKRQMGMAA